MQALCDDGTHELVILEFVKRELIKLEKYHSSLKAGGTINDALKTAGIFSKNNDRFIKSASLFNMNKIAELFKELYKTELLLKSGNTGKNLKNPMTDLILEIVKN
ncbi:MAG: hypothetical protein JW982_10720, partial [Spirochaetes bacterium]|nr:hypothetical protein [Spirochaetota bacterium]